MIISPATDHDQDAGALQHLIPVYLGPALDFFDRALHGQGDLAGLAQVRGRLGHDGWHEAYGHKHGLPEHECPTEQNTAPFVSGVD